MRIKKILSILLVCVMMFGCMSLGVSADEPTGTFTPDTAWYNDTDTEFVISTADELAGLAQLVNGGNKFSGKTVKLGADIDLENKEWTPIGISGKPFHGTFDGDGKVISDLSITGEASYVGLFGYTGGNPEKRNTIKNVTVDNVNISGRSYVGGIAGDSFVTEFDNCHVTGDIAIKGTDRYVGGIVGYIYGSVQNSSVVADAGTAGKISAYCFIGGIVGFVGEGNRVDSNVIASCTVENININGTVIIGGIAGSILTGATVAENSIDSTTIAASNDGYGLTALLVGQNDGGYNGGALTYVINNELENTTASNKGEAVTQLSGPAPATVVGVDVVFTDGSITSGSFAVEPPSSALADGFVVLPYNGSYSVEKETSNGAPDISITASCETLTGKGTVVLTVTGIPAGEDAELTCSIPGVKITEKRPGVYHAELPNETETYVFTVKFEGNDDWNSAIDSCSVRVIGTVTINPFLIPGHLTFVTNGGSEIDGIAFIMGARVDLSKYVPTKEGYTFTGWYADEALTEKLDTVRLRKHGSVVYAGWEANK